MSAEKIGPLEMPISHILGGMAQRWGEGVMPKGLIDERSIFLEALERTSAEDRSAFLDAACRDDRHLRDEVEALLSAHEDSCELLDAPARVLSGFESEWSGSSAGAVFGSYRLLEQIGDGGMGVVWKAEQTHPVRRTVALKIIKPGMDSRQVIARFEAERQALAILDHPNIAKVLDAGTTHRGRPYFVMELVSGAPITTYCDERHLTPRQRLELFLPVCHAVQHAHQKGIIHRDLKPSNVLVALYDDEVMPKVIDFGVAKATGQKLIDRTTMTQCGFLIGTLEYMSPEQATFNAQEVDTRSDVYALGVLLYELLTGSTPIEKERVHEVALDDGLRMIREEEPPRPSGRVMERIRLSSKRGRGMPEDAGEQPRNGAPGSSLAWICGRRKTDPVQLARLLRGDLDWIVMKALEKDRDRRYESASGLAMDVERYLADVPVLASPPSVRYRLRKFVRRNKGPVLAAALLALALVGGIIGTTWGMIRATLAQGVAVMEGKQKAAALAAALRSKRNATDQLFQALVNRAQAGRFSRQMGQRLESLAALAQAAGIRREDRLRDLAIAALALPDIERVPVRYSRPAGTIATAYALQEPLYARASDQGSISIRTIPDDREVRQIAAGPLSAYFFFSPDDRFLVGLGRDQRLHVWRVADGSSILRDEPRGCRHHAFSPDGQRLAVCHGDWVRTFDLPTGRERRRWRLPAHACTLAFHPDSHRLAVGHILSPVASIYDSDAGACLADLPVGDMSTQVVAWHPDGHRLAVAGSDPRIQIWNVAAKRRVAILEGHAQSVTVVTFHPDGDLVASHGWDGIVRLWNPASGRQLLQLASVGDPKFSGDGRWLLLSQPDEPADLLEVTPAREYRTLASNRDSGWAGLRLCDISSDGRLAAVGTDHGARLYDLVVGREVAALPNWTESVYFESGGPAEPDHGATSNSCSGLLTFGAGGLLRWPVTSDEKDGKVLHLGAPLQLSPLSRGTIVHSPDGRVQGTVSTLGGASKILDLATGTARQELPPHPDGDVQALSSDGQWAATCGWHSDRVRLWNAVTGAMVHEWILGKRTLVFFTPDSRALVLSRDDEFSFWNMKSLEPIYRLRRDVAFLPGWVAFSPDGRLMAVETAPAVIALKDVATGRTVARLEDPHGDRATSQGFTPDGTQLVVAACHAGAIHIWDFRAIRARLKAMNLDWDWPEFPPAASVNMASEAVMIEVAPVDQSWLTGMKEQWARQAIDRKRIAIEKSPDSAVDCNNLAWTLLTAPESLRQAQTAVCLAEKALRLAPGDANFRNTLGLAYYRAGRYRDAVQLIRPNLRSQSDKTMPYDLYFLAMSLHRLGETARARDHFDSAVRWTQMQHGLHGVPLDEPEGNEGLAAFRAEAAHVLGLDREKNQGSNAVERD
jgi:serine/threonine protein kinase/WD40 repeat protein